MKIKVALLFLFFLVQGVGMAQDKPIEDFDQSTYDLYIAKQWHALIEKGNQALAEEKGNFYIHYRIGIAYYELKKYRKAIPYFKKAMEFNNIDPTLKEYLYYCYVYTDQFGDAEKTHFTKTKFLQMINVEGGFKMYQPTTIYRQTNKYPLLFQKDTLYKDNLILGGGIYHSIGTGHHLYHNVSYIYFQQRNELKYQWQYFVQGDFNLPSQWTIKPAANFMSYNIHDPNNVVYSYPFKEYVLSLSAVKQTTAFKFECTNAYSRIADTNIIQHELGLEYFPFYNRKLSVSANIIMHGFDLYKNIHPVFIGGIKAQPVSFLEAQITYFYSKALYVSEQNGFFIYNNADRLEQRLQVLLNFNIHRRLVPYFLFNFENKYHLDPRTNNEISFNNHTLLTGIKIIIN